MATESFDPSAPMHLTERAANKARELIEEEGKAQMKLRVFVTGGGCSGFQYGFSFDEDNNDDDIQVHKNGVTLVVDSLSIQYLMGSEVDYEQGLMGSRFLVHNPSATSTCSCGVSFAI